MMQTRSCHVERVKSVRDIEEAHTHTPPLVILKHPLLGSILKPIMKKKVGTGTGISRIDSDSDSDSHLNLNLATNPSRRSSSWAVQAVERRRCEP